MAEFKKLIDIMSNKFSTIIQCNSNKSEFTTDFPIPLELDESFNYQIALQWFAVYNRVFNVNETNNQYKYNNVLYKLTPGSYELKDIFNEINLSIPEDKDNKIDFIIKMNYGKVKINKITKPINFNVDNSIASILGFEKKEYSKPSLGENKIDISNINSINIKCDLVQNTFIDGKRTNILYSFPYGTVGMGYRIIESPNPIIYLPLTRKYISSISFRIEDQNGRLVSFNGEEIMMTLHIHQV
jgi:hypothetical protein